MPLEKIFQASIAALREMNFIILFGDANTGAIKAKPGPKCKFKHSELEGKITTDNFKTHTVTIECVAKIMFGLANPFKDFSDEEFEIMKAIKAEAKK